MMASALTFTIHAARMDYNYVTRVKGQKVTKEYTKEIASYSTQAVSLELLKAST